MVSETIFRVIVPVLVIAFALQRGYYVKNHSKPEEATLEKRAEGLPSKVAGLLGLIGFISMIAFTLNPNWLDFADLEFSAWLRWAGVEIALLGSLLFISSNWLIGLCMIGMTVLEIISRIRYEESLMTEYFGEQYRAYMKRTGRLLPPLKPIISVNQRIERVCPKQGCGHRRAHTPVLGFYS